MYRDIYVEPNYVYTDAQSLYINETVKGSFASVLNINRGVAK